MSVANRVGVATDRVWDRLEDPALEPALSRRGDPALFEAAQQLLAMLERDALSAVNEPSADLARSQGLDELRANVAYCTGAVAALLWIGGADEDTRRALERMRNLLPQSEHPALNEALKVPEDFARLVHARWLLRHGRTAEARAVARDIDGERAPALAESAADIANALDPLPSPPSLGTLGGFGTALYGRRDVAADGSFLSTRFFTALYVPLVPLGAFRVVRSERGGWRFLGRAQLSLGARWHRALALALGAAGVVALAGFSITRTERYRLHRALGEVAEFEKSARDPKSVQAALSGHEGTFDRFYGKVDDQHLQPLALGIARLTARTIPEPIRVGDVDAALQVVRKLAALPEDTRRGEAASWVESRVEAWAKTLSGPEPERLTASLRLVGGAVSALGDSVSGLQVRRRALAVELGRLLEKDWPVAAVEAYAIAATEPAGEQALTKLVLELPPDALENLTPELEDWLNLGPSAASIEAAHELSELRERSWQRSQDKARAALLERDDEEELARTLEARPGDTGVRVALARKLRAGGKADAAKALLEKLGNAGVMPRSAALELALVLGELGRKREAEVVYEHLLLARLPAYEAARSRLQRRMMAKDRELRRQAEQNELPADLIRRLESTTNPAAARAVFEEWVQTSIAEDADVVRLRGRLALLEDVLPTALALGVLRLELAAGAEPKTKSEALAAAERTFLSIQSAGEGLPAYHLGLGTVYYRLGKAAEGDREFEHLLQGGAPELMLEVARAYRDLGQKARSRSVAEKARLAGNDETEKRAAVLLSLLADELDEQEKWLREADQNTEYVQTTLLQVQGHRAFRAGDLAGAERKFASAYEIIAKGAAVDGSRANNAALVASSRYACTGDVSHLRKAVELLDGARRLSPESAVVVQNMVMPLEYLAQLDALRSLIDVHALKLTEGEAAQVVNWLAKGDQRDAVLGALRASASFGRARDLVRQARALGPGWPEPYGHDLRWLMLFEDEAALQALKLQLASAELIDRSAEEQAREEWESGSQDARSRERIRGSMTRLAHRREDLHGPKAALGRAVLHALMASENDDLAALDLDPESAGKAAALYREAVNAWPSLGVRSDLAGALVRSAFLRALGPARKADATHALRRDGMTVTIWNWMRTNRRAELDALKAQPELSVAAKEYGSAADRELSELSYLVGKLTSDDALARRSKQSVANQARLVAIDVGALLGTGEVDTTVRELSRAVAAAELSASSAQLPNDEFAPQLGD